MSWQVEFRAGVWLPQIAWWLDAHFPQQRSFVSHAHSDHVAPHGEILCSAGTARLMQARVPGKRIEHVLPFGHAEQLTPDCSVTLHPAGHIHGSAQIHLAHDRHGTLLYTGDFKLRPGKSAEPCATPRAGLLIMETTFGRPHYVFPPTEQVLRDIAAFCHSCIEDAETPVLFGYSLGKSQELLCGLAAAQLPVMLHPQTHRLTRIYDELGIRFPAYREFDPAQVSGHVVICPPQASDSAFLQRIPRRRTAIVTGWALDPGAIYRYRCDAAFPLSDHADFPDLLRFVEAVQPAKVLTLHGFAQEFALTLRQRGIEAWAIGQDNQLEFGLPVAAAARPSGEAIPAAPGGLASECTPARPDCFSRFAAVAEQVKATPGKLEKIELLRRYLAGLSPDAAAPAALFFTARPFPQSDGRVLTMDWSVLKRAVLEAAQISEADYRTAFHRFADAGDATEAILAGRTFPATALTQCHSIGDTMTRPTGATLGEIAAFFAEVAGARGPAAKLERLRARLLQLSPVEAKYLVKIVKGDLRIGLKEGLVEEAIAAAAGQPLELVREANMLSGDIAEVTRAARTDALDTIQLHVFNPLQFMLASPEPTAEAIFARFAPREVDGSEAHPDSGASSPPGNGPANAVPTVWLEEKYDGIRCQLHKKGDRVELYSRELKRITGQFPDLARSAQWLAGDFIGDGELLAWRDGHALPFAELQKRLGRKGDDFFLGAEIPVCISFYDLLWLNGRSLLKEPLAVRRKLLDGLIDPPAVVRHPQFVVAPVQFAHSAVEIEAAFLAARQRGHEGLIAKDPASGYTPGRRGLAWLKYGHGKRRDP